MSKKEEKYPKKRGYAVGKLQKFLAEANLTKRFRENVKNSKYPSKGHVSIEEAFSWLYSNEGFSFWDNVTSEFIHYVDTGKVFHVYSN